ncbi:A kinase (PRKA) anchor protein 1b [Brachionichthys hirsutus]|uniref:A kinase (PRKA) anchor protein 1b n=1 Tax=Brachionichthys hirsutus TaxID=412623 RepID=UPI003604DEBC
MPLRFRSVVPYTLPGILALIGWWWYVSRKKERLARRDGPEQSPTTVGLRTLPTDDSNGLPERSAASLRNETEVSTQLSPKISCERIEPESISQVVIQDNEAAASLEQSSEEAALERISKEVAMSSSPSLQLTSKDDNLQLLLKGDKEPDKNSSPDLGKDLEMQLIKVPAEVEEMLLPCQPTEVTCSPFTETRLSDAERPEPEGEVAKHSGSVNIPEEMSICVAISGQRVGGSEVDSLESPPLAQDFHRRILTSTLGMSALASTPLTTRRDSTTTTMSPEHIRVQSGQGEDRDLERLASELITEVISAATQEVFTVSSCQVTDNGCSRGRQEPVITEKQRHHLLKSHAQIGCESREATENDEQGMSNGCSTLSHGVHQTNNAQRAHWPTPPHPAAQGAPLQTGITKEEAAALAEDSACSTCHSEDGLGSEDLQNSMFSNPTDALRVTGCSEGPATQPQPLVGTSPEATALVDVEENSEGAVCELKRLNGTGLRNGVHGTCEGETDQSGGSDVNSMDSVDSGCTMGAGESQSNHTASSNSELIVWEVEVPKYHVGRLIGRQGRYVSFLKQSSGAKIYISTLPYTQEIQICHIEGTQQQVDKALSLIGKKFTDLDLTNLYAPPPPPLTLPSLPMTSWLLLPSGVTVEVIVVNIVSAGHIFVQQHTHPTYHALRSLDQQMFLCYSQPGTPTLPSPAEVGVICAAPAVEGAWWRAQVISFYKETSEVEIRYVDYGGYDRVKIDSLRQIRSDFVTLPFQGAEVLLDNVAPLPGEDRFSAEATSALEELTRGVALLAQVSSYDNGTGLPLIHLWNMVGDEIMSVNRSLAERGVALWVDGF